MNGRETIVMHTPGPLLDPAEYDEQGRAKRAAEVVVDVAGCDLAPEGAQESRQMFGQYVVTGYKVFAPAGTTVDADATFTIRGVAGWQMEGEVGDWRSRSSGGRRGVVFSVKRGS